LRDCPHRAILPAARRIRQILTARQALLRMRHIATKSRPTPSRRSH
jgi:hypothetical protein